MSVEQQALERSVLEGKDREELASIAGALGLKPASRASKATLINQILKGAGVDTSDDKPKRSRAKAADVNGDAREASEDAGDDAPSATTFDSSAPSMFESSVTT